LLHVPSITKNLISVSQFLKDNSVYFEFHPSLCFVKSQATNEILLRGHLGVDGFYQFPPFLLTTSAKNSNNSVLSTIPLVHFTIVKNFSNSLSVWHLRQGHVHFDALKIVLSKCNIPVVNKSLDFYTSCCLGKAHKFPSSASTAHYNAPWELFLVIFGGLPLYFFNWLLVLYDFC